MDQTYQLNAPSVVSEVIDGEAVIMHLQSGKYYSAASSGGLIWACIERTQPTSHILDLFVAQYAATPDQAKTAVDGFIAELIAQDLIRSADGGPAALVSLSDMQDLLLLDPIHDVDEAGWPTPSASMKT